MWGVIVAAGVALASAYVSSRSEQANADSAWSAAQANAANRLQAGLNNAAAIKQAASLNAALTLAGADINASTTWDVAKYNASMQRMLGEFNAGLLMDEAELVAEAAEVDIDIARYYAEKDRGTILSNFGASGIQINDSDAVVSAIVDNQTQHEMNIAVIQNNADIQVAKLRNAAAQSEWEAQLASSQILYEGNIAATNTRTNAGLSAVGTLMQGRISSSTTATNAGIDANNTLASGWANYQSGLNSANSTMTSGLFSAAGSIAAGYMDQATDIHTGTTSAGGVPTTNVRPYRLGGSNSQSSLSESLLAD